MQNYKLISLTVIKVFILTTSYLLLTSVASAATISIDPPAGEFGPGDTFIATVRLDPDLDECINVVSATINYPADWLKISATSKGESFLTLWPEEPVIDLEHGTIKFSGGIPAGYCGRVDGDPGQSNVVGKIIFTVPGNMIGGRRPVGGDEMIVGFSPDTAVYLNDGLGSRASLTMNSATYIRALASSGIPNEWVEAVNDDDLSPDSFNVTLTQDKNTFQGKWFVAFGTVDKQSGIDHYELMEEDGARFGYIRDSNEKSFFRVTTSPFVLQDQTLKSRVTVRAIDHAGNVAETILAPKNLDITKLDVSGGTAGFSPIQYGVAGGITLFVILAGGVFWFIRKKKSADDVSAPRE